MGDGGSTSLPKNINNCFIQHLRGEGVAEYRNFPDIRMLIWGPGYVSGIATSYELDGPGIESRSGHHFPPDRHWVTPSLLYNGYRVDCRGKSGRGVEVTTHPI